MKTFVGSIVISGMATHTVFGWRVSPFMMEAINIDEAVGKCHALAREQNLFPEIQSNRAVDVCLMEITSASPITEVKKS